MVDWSARRIADAAFEMRDSDSDGVLKAVHFNNRSADWLDAPADMRAQHLFWNADAPASLPPLAPYRWTTAIAAARQKLLSQDDLVTQLLKIVANIP